MPDLVGDVLDHAPRGLLTAESSTDDEDCFQDVVERALVRAQHAGAGGDEVADDVALEIGERQHEVGLEGQDPIELERREAADPCLLPRRLGPPGRAGDADDALAGADQKGDLGGLGGEADDALRELGATRPVHRRVGRSLGGAGRPGPRHAGVAQSLRQQRPRDRRSPPLREHFAGDGDRTELAIPVHSGGTLGSPRVGGKFIFWLCAPGHTLHSRRDDATDCRAPNRGRPPCTLNSNMKESGPCT